METTKTKFERTREKFRQNMQREAGNIRRTIFLHDDELPSSSKNPPITKQSNPKRTRSTTHSQPRSKRGPKKVKKAYNFRMTVVTPPSADPAQVDKPEEEVPIFPSDRERPDTDVICISDEEIPAPPKWPDESPSEATSPSKPTEETRGEHDTIEQTPPPPPWDEECLSLSDLDINSEDLNDPLILEFYRSFWGMSDNTVDRRPPSPPSPVSSFSSLDWESENFRPPTPSKRKGFVNCEVQDRRYTHLGLQCYERVCRVQVMVPPTTNTAAITNYTHPQTEDLPERGPACTPSRPETLDATKPITPGRKWLNLRIYDNYGEQQEPHQPTSLPTESCDESPAPSPPPLFPQSPPPAPVLTQTSTVIPNQAVLEELPQVVQREILARQENNKGKRIRFVQEIWGHQYRIIITRGGEVKINRM